MMLSIDLHKSPVAPERTMEGLPADLSLDLGKFYEDDLRYFLHKPDELEAYFGSIRPYINAATESNANAYNLNRASRVSTCVFIGDLSVATNETPRKIIRDLIVRAALNADVAIDYVGLESGFTTEPTEHESVAQIVLHRILEEPEEGFSFFNVPTLPHETGWLRNGLPETTEREHPLTNGFPHTIFCDVQLFSEREEGNRVYSPAFLAAVWDLTRLGLVYRSGAMVGRPEIVPVDDIGDSWRALPPVMQLAEGVAPFHGYKTHSFVPFGQMSIENGARYVVEHYSRVVDSNQGGDVGYMEEASSSEGLELMEPTDRTGTTILRALLR